MQVRHLSPFRLCKIAELRGAQGLIFRGTSIPATDVIRRSAPRISAFVATSGMQGEEAR